MAVIKVVNSKASIAKAIKYVSKEEKTQEKLISGKDCSPNTVIDEMKATKEQWGKTEGRQYKHYIQSFNPEDKITADKAHKIGLEWAENNFKGYEVLVATHVDKDHMHNHFIVNSVSFENGEKYQQSKKDLQKLKDYSDNICSREGLSVIKEKSNEITAFEQSKYRAIEKGAAEKEKSYLLDTAKDVSSSLKTSNTREGFIKNMEDKGYQVNWKDTRKYITFTTPDGKKVRNNNLEKTFKDQRFTKEGIEIELQRNREAGREHGNRRNTSNVDWSTIRDNVQDQGNRVSEYSSHDVTGTIQQKVREIKDRTDRATRENRKDNGAASTVQRYIKQQSKEDTRKLQQKIRERDREFER